MKIAIGNDHTAVELKNIIKEFVESKGYEVIDMGTNSSESCDYPVYGEKVGPAVASGEADLGITICGTGVESPYAQQGEGRARLRMQRAVHGKAVQDAQQYKRAGLRRKGSGKRDGQDDHRRVAGRQV